MPFRRALLAAAAGLALADAAIVTLALPDLLVELDTTVEGVAAVIAIYTATLAIVPIPAAALATRIGGRAVAVGGFALFTVASLLCAVADSLTVLLVARALQGAGGAAGLVAAFPVIRGRDAAGLRWWVAAAVFAAAIGPALGGALTEAFDWRAIFIVQAPIAAAAVVAALTMAREIEPREPSGQVAWRAAAGLMLLSAALTAVIFLLVLLLIAGFATSPLTAAGLVTITPIAALLGARLPGHQGARAAAGALLIAGGTLALAWLPGDRLAYTVLPQVLAGTGMGLALTALAGNMLPERSVTDAARLLSLRHAGIALAIIGLAPVVAADLETATERAQLRGVALVLDADLEPSAKLELAPALLSAVDADRPRAGLREAAPAARATVPEEDRATVDGLVTRADAVLVRAVDEAFRRAFQITGGLALLGALILIPLGAPGRALAAVSVALAIAVVVPVFYARQHDRLAPEPVRIADPCQERAAPQAGGLGGFLQGQALSALDRSACRFGSSREELVLALFDDAARRRFMERYEADPRGLGGILGGLFG